MSGIIIRKSVSKEEENRILTLLLKKAKEELNE